MATVKGILGQLAPAATTLLALYTVPASKNATVKVIIANRSSVAATFRVAVAVDGAADSNEQYVVYDKAIAGNDPGSTTSIVIGSGDVIRVYASTANLSFNCTGIEQDD